MYGHELSIALGFPQSTQQSKTSPTLHWLPVLSESIGIKTEPLIQSGMRGLLDEGTHHQGAINIRGEIELEIDTLLLGLLLKGMMTVNSTQKSDETTVYEHQFTPAVADIHALFANPILVLYKQWAKQGDGSAECFSHMQMDRLSLTMVAGQFFIAKAEVIGGAHSWENQKTPVYTPVAPWSWQQAHCTIGVSNPQIAGITEITIDIQDNLQADHTLGGGLYPSRVKRSGARTIAVQGKIKLDDAAEYKQFLSGITRPLHLVFEGENIGNTEIKEKIDIQIPHFRYQEFMPTASGQGEVEVSFSGKALRDATESSAIQITLTNGESSV